MPGLALAIEPMVTLGEPGTRELDDGWTVVTADGSCAAHFEHTVAITEDGPVGAHRGGRRRQPVRRAGPEGAATSMTGPVEPESLRAGNADREQVVAQLNKAFAEGRLDVRELDERVAAAYAAKTMGELVPLTADLPSDRALAPRAGGPPARPPRTGRSSRAPARRRSPARSGCSWSTC